MSNWLTRLMCRLFGCYPRTGAAIWSSGGYDRATCCYCGRSIWAVSVPRDFHEDFMKPGDKPFAARSPSRTADKL